MIVTVKFYGVHRALTNAPEIRISLPRNGRLSDAISHVKGRFPALKLSQKDVLVSVNDLVTHEDHVLKADDRISFLPHIGGG